MIKIHANKMILNINPNGYIVDIIGDAGVSLFPEIEAPFLRIGIDGQLIYPISAAFNGKELELEMENGFKLSLNVTQKEQYTTFTVKHIPDGCDTILFGPYPTVLGETIGDVIGVVRAKGFAIGIQALNIKTIAGYPQEYKEDAYKEYASDKRMSEISVEPLDYFKSAAYGTDFGSVLQLYCNNRSRARIRTVMGCDHVPVPAMDGADSRIDGAAFALFGCDEDKVLSIIGEIELGEGLPHPMMNGEWAKISRDSMRSYMIAGFDENNIDRMLEYTEAAGFKQLYHPDPFRDWGHFTLKEEYFPNGDISLIKMAGKAAEKGIGLGLHTLTNFTTKNDCYITPVPHKDLAVRGQTTILCDVNVEDDIIKVSTKEIFEEASYLSTAWIEDELIQYSSVCEVDGGYAITGCKRGAFGTVAAVHSAGAEIKKLWDHGYKVFFPNVKLQDQYSDRLVELYNKAGIVQISFDGLEGCRYAGEDEYAVNRFCMQCYDGWNHPVINDASQLNHNLWHMNTRMNWGEPWGAKMREGGMEQRIKNQEFYRKNLFPRMLGWFLVRSADRKFEATSLEDIEWMLSKAAGFDAGFALVSNINVFDKLGITDEILEKVRMWEKLRLQDVFPDELKKALLHPETEWHLEKGENDIYKLFPLDISQTYHSDLIEMQPGQPGGADWTFTNKLGAGRFGCRIRVMGDGYIENPTLKTGAGMIRFECRIEGNQYLIYRNDGSAFITDRNYNRISEARISGNAVLSSGTQQLSFSCDFGGEEAPELSLTMITSGKPYDMISAK